MSDCNYSTTTWHIAQKGKYRLLLKTNRNCWNKTFYCRLLWMTAIEKTDGKKLVSMKIPTDLPFWGLCPPPLRIPGSAPDLRSIWELVYKRLHERGFWIFCFRLFLYQEHETLQSIWSYPEVIAAYFPCRSNCNLIMYNVLDNGVRK